MRLSARPATRPAIVAGTFYPEEAAVLQQQVAQLITPLQDKPLSSTPVTGEAKALIVPHAGYQYSGPVAGHVYATLQGCAQQISRVVLLGPSHRVPLWDLALPDAEAFATPLGQVPLDRQVCEQLAQLPQVVISAEAHAFEHSLEVQLPFLQHCLNDFKLVPLVVGESAPSAVAEVIDAAWGGEETLLVFSTDLSHFLPYSQACRQDLATCERIEKKQGPLSGEQACGCMALNGLLEYAKQRPLTIQCLEYLNSGDTAGEKRRVVGYGGYVVYAS